MALTTTEVTIIGVSGFVIVLEAGVFFYLYNQQAAQLRAAQQAAIDAGNPINILTGIVKGAASFLPFLALI